MEWLNLLREAFLSLQRYLRGGHVAQNVVLGTRPITTEVLQAFAREIAEEDEVPLISPFHVQFMPSEEPPADETVNEQSPDNKVRFWSEENFWPRKYSLCVPVWEVRSVGP